MAQRMAELEKEKFKKGIETGLVKIEKRKQLLKYKEHLKNL